MAITWGDASCKAACDARAARLNSGFFRILSAGDVLLAELTFGATAFGAATTANPAVATANAITRDSAANATGTAAKYQLVRTDGTTIEATGTVTATGGGGDLTMPSTAVVAGQPVEVSAFDLRQS